VSREAGKLGSGEARKPRDLGGVIAAESPRTCSRCGVRAETRPYGRGGAEVCFDCGTSAENRASLDVAMEERFGYGPGLAPGAWRLWVKS